MFRAPRLPAAVVAASLSIASAARAETYVVEIDLSTASATFGDPTPLWAAAGRANTLTLTVADPTWTYFAPDPFQCFFLGNCSTWSIASGPWTASFDGPDAAMLTSEMGALDQGWSDVSIPSGTPTGTAPFAIAYDGSSYQLYVYLLTLGAGGGVGPGMGGNSVELTAFTGPGAGFEVDPGGFAYVAGDVTTSSYPILRDFDVGFGGIFADTAPGAVTVRVGGPTIELGGSCPAAVTVAARSFTPSGAVAIVAANGPGAVVVPSGPCAGTQLGLSASGLRLLKTVTANAAGQINYAGSVGPICGKTIQFVDMTTCTPSNVDTF